MIRVTIELLSAVDGHVETLGIATIANDGTGSPGAGNYDVKLYPRGSRWTPGRGCGIKPWRTGRVIGFPRKRLLVWDLLYRALRHTLADRLDKRV